MRASIVLLVLLAGVVIGAAPAEKPVTAPNPPRPIPGDAQDLVLFLDSRPCLIRLHLQVKGRSFQTNWDETVDHLFRYLDVDGDGILSRKEAALAPSIAQWVQLMGGTLVEPDAAPDFAVLAGGPSGTKATRDHFLRYYRSSGAGALQIEWGWRPPAQDNLSDVLFRQLDTNKDGALSREEMAAAPATLHPLDIDGDDLIRAAELDGGRVYPDFTFRSSAEKQSVPKNFPFLILHADTPATLLANQLLARYDRNKDRKLDRTELPLDRPAFERLDTNRDGGLVAGELAGWRTLPPELKLIVSLEKNARRDILVLPASEDKANRLTALLPPSRDGALRLPIGEKQLEVVRNNGPTMQQTLLKQFDALAGPGGILSEKAIYRPPFTFVALLRLADRNGDNRLSHEELAAFLAMQEKFFYRSSYLTVVDRGASLFEFLDGDHDGRLSPRELRSAWARLAPWDREGSGRVARQQVPRQFQLVLSYGQPRVNLPVAGGAGYADLPLFRDRSRGPLWFRKMDRNADGDVSPSEFLGTREQFRRIDTDGDGLIDIPEAERADQELRKRP
jgi:Ca2+-binding EF-hand superfamily protein